MRLPSVSSPQGADRNNGLLLVWGKGEGSGGAAATAFSLYFLSQALSFRSERSEERNLYFSAQAADTIPQKVYKAIFSLNFSRKTKN